MSKEIKYCAIYKENYRSKCEYVKCLNPNEADCSQCISAHSGKIKARPTASPKRKRHCRSKAEKQTHEQNSHTTSMCVYTRMFAPFCVLNSLPLRAGGDKQAYEILKAQESRILSIDTLGGLTEIPLALYEKSKDPTYLLEAFITAHKFDLFPPEIVIGIMANIFKEYLESIGSKSLDELFGFKRKKEGAGRKKLDDDVFKIRAKKETYGKLLFDMVALILTCDVTPELTVKQAAEMVIGRSGLDVKPDTLVQAFARQGFRKFKNPTMRDIFANRSDDNKKADLLNYPINTIPRRIITKYKLK